MGKTDWLGKRGYREAERGWVVGTKVGEGCCGVSGLGMSGGGVGGGGGGGEG
jgi:hypothetical protein